MPGGSKPAQQLSDCAERRRAVAAKPSLPGGLVWWICGGEELRFIADEGCGLYRRWIGRGNGRSDIAVALSCRKCHSEPVRAMLLLKTETLDPRGPAELGRSAGFWK